MEGRIIAVDVETDGLSVYHGHRPFCFSYCTEKGEHGFFDFDEHGKVWLARLFQDPTKVVVFHNAKFDLKMLHWSGIDIYDCRASVHCTLILSKLHNEQGNHDLRSLALRYLNRRTEHKDDISDWVKQNRRRYRKEYGRDPTFADAPRELVKNRAKWDTSSTLLVFSYLYPKVMRASPELYQTELDLLRVCIDMEDHGVRVDLTRARELREEALKGISKIQAELDEMVLPLEVEKTKKGEKVKVVIEDHFNVGSTGVQMPAAFHKMGIKLKYRTKPKKNKKKGYKTGGGRWSFDEYAMMRYVSKPLSSVIRDSSDEGWKFDRWYHEVHQVVKKNKLDKRELLPPLVLKLRELQKMVSTYYDNILSGAVDIEVDAGGRETGILHCSFNQSEALTGRFSASNPNLQNMPRLLGPRECFICRRGRRNWHIDYEQVEMKFFVHFAEDEEMASAINDDIHLHVAAKIYRLPKEAVSKEKRKRAKAVNFGIIYGSGAETMAETLTKRGLPTSKLEAAALVGDYHREFPSVRALTTRLKNELVRQGFIENPYGRRYHIPSNVSYRALNYMCQGTSADLIKVSMVAIWKWLRKKGLKTKLIKTIHDEIVLEVPPAEERIVIPAVIQIMEEHTRFFIPITVSLEKTSTRWNEKREVPKDAFAKRSS